MVIVFNIPLLVLWIWEFGYFGARRVTTWKPFADALVLVSTSQREFVLYIDYSVKLNIWCYTCATICSSWRDIFECLISLDPFSPEVAAGIRVESNGEADAWHHDWLIDRSQRNVGIEFLYLEEWLSHLATLVCQVLFWPRPKCPTMGPIYFGAQRWKKWQYLKSKEFHEFRVTSGDATPKRYFPKNGINLRWMKQGYMI